jgi:hypothetical protein
VLAHRRRQATSLQHTMMALLQGAKNKQRTWRLPKQRTSLAPCTPASAALRQRCRCVHALCARARNARTLASLMRPASKEIHARHTASRVLWQRVHMRALTRAGNSSSNRRQPQPASKARRLGNAAVDPCRQLARSHDHRRCCRSARMHTVHDWQSCAPRTVCAPCTHSQVVLRHAVTHVHTPAHTRHSSRQLRQAPHTPGRRAACCMTRKRAHMLRH